MNETAPTKFEDMVRKLVKPGATILAEISPEEAHLMHMLLGLAGEVGELVDAIKKWIIYRKPLDRVNLREELGDIEFYLEGIRQVFHIERSTVLEANIAKLSDRYKKLTYSDQAAQDRADKTASTRPVPEFEGQQNFPNSQL